MNVNNLDLNLLRVFDAVMDTGSITVAGNRLGLTQPAMSNALRRLRDLLNDSLFVRTTAGMKPTPYGQRLGPPIRGALASIQSALAVDVGFDPKTSKRCFNIVTTDVGELMFLPRMLSKLMTTAPSVTVSSSQIPREKYREALESGVADLAIGQLPEMHTDFHQQVLREETMVCLLRRNHGAIGDTLDLEQFLAAKHVAIVHTSAGDSSVRKALGKRAGRRQVMLHLPHYTTVPMILAESDLIAVMPQAIATAFSKLKELKTLPLPFRMPSVQVRQFWHERSHRDAAHRWLRNLFASTSRKS